MTALWFACQEAPERNPDDGRRLAKSGVLLALNTTSFARHATIGDPYGRTWGWLEHGAGWTLESALSDPRPFVVAQTTPNARLRAQEGFFVAGSVPARTGRLRHFTDPFYSLDVPFPPGDPEDLADRLTKDRKPGSPKPIPFVAVIIGAGLKSKLLAYLDGSYNRRASTLFPDYQGFGEAGVGVLTPIPRTPRVMPTEVVGESGVGGGAVDS